MSRKKPTPITAFPLPVEATEQEQDLIRRLQHEINQGEKDHPRLALDLLYLAGADFTEAENNLLRVLGKLQPFAEQEKGFGPISKVVAKLKIAYCEMTWTRNPTHVNQPKIDRALWDLHYQKCLLRDPTHVRLCPPALWHPHLQPLLPTPDPLPFSVQAPLIICGVTFDPDTQQSYLILQTFTEPFHYLHALPDEVMAQGHYTRADLDRLKEVG